MKIQLTYKAAMQRLADLSGPEYPPHVQVKAVCKIASELSPNNPRHADVMRALNSEESPHEPASQPLIEPGEHPYAALLAEAQQSQDAKDDDEEESAAADDDPL